MQSLDRKEGYRGLVNLIFFALHGPRFVITLPVVLFTFFPVGFALCFIAVAYLLGFGSCLLFSIGREADLFDNDIM